MVRARHDKQSYLVEPHFRALPFAGLVASVRFLSDGFLFVATGLARRLSAVVGLSRRRHEHKKTVRALHSLSDHVLSDIGIERGSIERAVRDIERGVDPRR